MVVIFFSKVLLKVITSRVDTVVQNGGKNTVHLKKKPLECISYRLEF